MANIRNTVCVILTILLSSTIISCEKKEDSAPSPIDQSQLKSLAFWRSGSLTGCVEVNLDSQVISAAGTQLSRKGWRAFQASITNDERRRLHEMVTITGLRSFNPEANWFGESKVISGSAALLLVWEDMELAFSIPFEHIPKELPSEAYVSYNDIRIITNYLVRLERKYAEDSELIEPADDKYHQEFRRRLLHVWEITLPKERNGW